MSVLWPYGSSRIHVAGRRLQLVLHGQHGPQLLLIVFASMSNELLHGGNTSEEAHTALAFVRAHWMVHPKQ